jgi:hypothetical protein
MTARKNTAAALADATVEELSGSIDDLEARAQADAEADMDAEVIDLVPDADDDEVEDDEVAEDEVDSPTLSQLRLAVLEAQHGVLVAQTTLESYTAKVVENREAQKVLRAQLQDLRTAAEAIRDDSSEAREIVREERALLKARREALKAAREAARTQA